MNQNQTSVLTVMLNGDQAEKELKRLEQRAYDLNVAFKEAKKNGDMAAFSIKKEWEAAKKAVKDFQKDVIDTNKVLKSLSTATPKELRETLKSLNKQLNSGDIKRGSKDWITLNTNIKKVRTEINRINADAMIGESRLSRMANGFNKYFAGFMTLVGSITGVSFAFRKLSEDVAKMDDVYADVQKTTGLTRDEVVALNEDFKKMDTRTAREQLNELARDAGKLGISAKKDVLDFVDAGNQINVALGEDLGEGAIRNIGKITEVFKLSTKELDGMDLKGRMLAVGSAINELGQSSTANEAYLVNFTQRLGGVAAQAGISVQNILGYASALDQSGQAVEMSATALQKFIMSIMGDPAKFARIAGLEVGKFNTLLKTDTNAAIKTVLTSLSNKGGFQQLIPVFQEMGLDGARAVGVLSALATNIGKVDEAQRISNTAFSEGVSLTNEYNVKNNNLMAQLEKRRKEFKDAALELGERLNPALLQSTNILTYIVRLLPGLLYFLGKYGKYILYYVSVYALYTAAIKLNVLWQKKFSTALTLNNVLLKAKSVWLSAARVAMLAYNVVVGLLTGNITRMSAAWKLLKLAMASNPLGLVLVVATSLIPVFKSIWQWMNRTNEETKRAKEIAKDAAEATKEYSSAIAKEQSGFEGLLRAIISANEKSALRKDLIKQIKNEYPQLLKFLDLERMNNEELAGVLRVVNGLYEKRYDLAALKGNKDAEDNQIIKAKQRQIEIREEIKALQQLNDHRNNQSAKIRKLETEYEKLNGIVSKGMAKSAEYQRQATVIQSDLDKHNSVEGLSQMMNEISDKIKVQQAWVEEISSLPGISKESKLKAKTDLKNLLSELDVITSEWEAANKKKNEGGAEIVSESVVSPIDTPSGSNGSDNALKKLESDIRQRKNFLMQSYLEEQISREKYLYELEQIEKDALYAKLELYNVEPEKQSEIMATILQKQIEAKATMLKSEEEYQQKLKDIQENAEKERQQRNWDNLKAIAKQNEENYKAQKEKEIAQKQELIQIGMDFSNDMGELLAGAITGNEDLVTSSLKSIISMGLDLLKVQVQMSIVGATAQSLAQPDSILTFGATGLARAAILTGLIEAAFATVKSVINNTLGNLGKKQYYTGGYTSPDGNWDEPDGIVHKKEFVGNRFSVANPVVRKFYNIIDVAQRNNTVGSLTEKDFATAMNYRQYSQEKAFGAALATSSVPQSSTPDGSAAVIAAALARSSDIYDKLSKRLDEKIVAETYIEGKGGSKEANNLYNRMKKNVSRS